MKRTDIFIIVSSLLVLLATYFGFYYMLSTDDKQEQDPELKLIIEKDGLKLYRVLDNYTYIYFIDTLDENDKTLSQPRVIKQ